MYRSYYLYMHLLYSCVTNIYFCFFKLYY